MERAAAMTDMYDQALLGILQHVGNVQEFLGILFGFLYRKTDFYRLLQQPGDRLGFPPGVAKSITLGVSGGGRLAAACARAGLWAAPHPLQDCKRGLPLPVAAGSYRDL